MTHTPNGEREAAEVLAAHLADLCRLVKVFDENNMPAVAKETESAISELSPILALLQSPAAVQQGEAVDELAGCSVCDGNPRIFKCGFCGRSLAPTPSPASPEVGGLVDAAMVERALAAYDKGGPTHTEAMHDALAAALAPSAESAFVRVPREPTPEQLAALGREWDIPADFAAGDYATILRIFAPTATDEGEVS